MYKLIIPSSTHGILTEAVYSSSEINNITVMRRGRVEKVNHLLSYPAIIFTLL